MGLISTGRTPIGIRVTSAGMDALRPDDGEIIRLLVDPARGVEWQLGYDPATSPTFPWLFLGGAALAAFIPTTASEATGQTGLWVTLQNADGPGPDVIVPRDGAYEVYCEAGVSGSTQGVFHGVAVQIGSTGGDPANADAAVSYNDRIVSVSRTRFITASKGDRFRMLYRTDDADTTVSQFSRRVVRVLPTRLA